MRRMLSASSAGLFVCLLSLAVPAYASGVKVRSYGGGAASVSQFSTNGFSVQSFGAYSSGAPFGVSTFGVSPFGVSPFAVTPFGFNSSPFGVSTFGVTPFSVTPFGFNSSLDSIQTFGVSPFGVGTFSASSSARGFRNQPFFVPTPTFFVPNNPGTKSPGGNDDVMNEIKQIKENVKALRDDVDKLRKDVDAIKKPKADEDPGLSSEETKRKLKELRVKYKKYLEELEEFHVKQRELIVFRDKVGSEFVQDQKNPAKKKALDDAQKALDDLVAPVFKP